jgi:hypothetical protein
VISGHSGDKALKFPLFGAPTCDEGKSGEVQRTVVARSERTRINAVPDRWIFNFCPNHFQHKQT